LHALEHRLKRLMVAAILFAIFVPGPIHARRTNRQLNLEANAAQKQARARAKALKKAAKQAQKDHRQAAGR
jgi:hypothetical protein